VDRRVQESETATFECYFAGNPKPDVSWYYNGKLLKSNPNIKVRLTDCVSSCTLTEVTTEMAGEYVCKAISPSGSVATKAQLRVYELTGEALEQWEAKKAKAREEILNAEKARKKEKKAAKMTKADYLKQNQDERDKKVKKEQKMAESEAKEKAAQEEAAKIAEAKSLSTPKQVCLADIMSGADETVTKKSEKSVKLSQKKVAKTTVQVVDEGMTKFIEKQTIGLRALIQMANQESLSIAEVVAQHGTKELDQENLDVETAKVDSLLQAGITVDQIVTMGTTGDLTVLNAPESQTALVQLVEKQGHKAITRQVMVSEATKLAPEEPIGLKAVLRAIEEKTANIEDITAMATNPEEFNLEASPVAEMAQILSFVNEGVSSEEIISLVKAGDLPALKLPENQWPLVQVMEKLGQTATVSKVIVEEPTVNLEINEFDEIKTTDEKVDRFIAKQSIGLRALVQMAVQESLNVTDVVPEDKAQDFNPGPAPFKEFSNIDMMLKSGITVDQIVTLGVAGHLPKLTAPESQTSLVRLVEDQGFTAVTRQVRNDLYFPAYTCTFNSQIA